MIILQIKLMSESVMARRLTFKRGARRPKEEKQQSKEPSAAMRQVENKFVGMNHHANTHFICSCEICEKSLGGLPLSYLRQPTFLRVKQVAAIMLHKKSNMKDLLTYLAPTKKRKGLRVQIPEICFYEDGQPQSIFMTAKEEIKYLKPQKLSQRQVLHTFLQQKRLYKEALKEKYESSIMSHIDFEEVHQKYLKSILPPFKTGGVDRHKGFKSFKIHKDNMLMMDSLVQHQNKDTDEVCLIKRIGGSFELMNEIQFMNLMRNRGGITTDIELIQSFIRPKRLAESLIYSEYAVWDLIEKKHLFERASQEIQIILEIIPNISPLYISREASEQFEVGLRDNPTDYALYQTYKIIHYLHKAADIKTLHIKLGWLVNDIDLFYLYAVPEFVFENINFEAEGKLTKLEFERAKHQIKEMDGVQNYLLEKWEDMKKQKDIDTERLAAKPSNRSDEVFAILHPGINFEKLMKSDHFQSKVHHLVDTRSTKSATKQLRPLSQSPLKSPLKSTYAETKTSGRLWITSPSP